MYTRHEEGSIPVNAPLEATFNSLDDHARLSAHMSSSSWQMGGGTMQTKTDAGNFQAVGSHLILSGKAFGIPLYVDEVVTKREPPTTKVWETIGSPKLLVIGPYRMGFELSPVNGGKLRVFIDYALPARGLARLLGSLFGPFYARWCVRQMLAGAERIEVGAVSL